MHNMFDKIPNMGNSFVYFRHSSVPGVNLFNVVGVNCSLIPDRLSEPARSEILLIEIFHAVFLYVS